MVYLTLIKMADVQFVRMLYAECRISIRKEVDVFFVLTFLIIR